jgi:hypothetical protein
MLVFIMVVEDTDKEDGVAGDPAIRAGASSGVRAHRRVTGWTFSSRQETAKSPFPKATLPHHR